MYNNKVLHNIMQIYMELKLLVDFVLVSEPITMTQKNKFPVKVVEHHIKVKSAVTH